MYKMYKISGFTLIELLIVVAIIAILAVIAIPQFNKYRSNAEKAAVESAVRNCITEIEAKLSENIHYEINSSECNHLEKYPIDNISISGNMSNYKVRVKGKIWGWICEGGMGNSIKCYRGSI